MACGCKDKEKDAIIIAEVERRKSLAVEYEFEYFEYSGDLQLAISMVNQDEIIQIVSTGDKKWNISLRKTK